MLRRALRYALLLGLGLGLGGCGQPPPYQQQFYVFGTLVDITIVGASEASAAAAVNEIQQRFQAMHKNWHAWQPGPLMELNQALAEGRPFRPEPSLLPLIRLSQELSAQSEGLFNPAINRLVGLWGFHQQESWQPPSEQDVQALVAQHPSMADIHISAEGEVTCANPAVQLDFGAIAKGYAVDLALDYLRSQGIHHAIVNAGGNLRVIGDNHGQPWRIGIRHPSGEGVLAALEVADGESVFTSGNYERYREYQGRRYAHIIDPRNGMPVAETASITLVHPNATVADAASTALAVAGVAEWERVAQRMGITQVLLVDARGKIHLSPEMERRVRFLDH